MSVQYSSKLLSCNANLCLFTVYSIYTEWNYVASKKYTMARTSITNTLDMHAVTVNSQRGARCEYKQAILTQVLYNVVYGWFEQRIHCIWIHPQHALRRPLHKVHAAVSTGEMIKQKQTQRHHQNWLILTYMQSTNIIYSWLLKTLYYWCIVLGFITLKIIVCVLISNISS